MKAKIQRWGRSLAVRIPRSLATDAGLSEDVAVELSLEQGKVVVDPQVVTPLRLEELLQRITPENLHAPWSTGIAVDS